MHEILPEPFGTEPLTAQRVVTRRDGDLRSYPSLYRAGSEDLREDELRIVTLSGTEVPLSAEWVERGESPSPKRVRVEGWWVNPIGAIPEEFGAFVNLTGARNQRALIFQNSDGEITVIGMQGAKIPPRALRITREY